MRDVIWCPDDQSPRFLAMLQGLWKGLETDGNLIPVIGSYKGESEFAFICSENDFRNIVARRGWAEDQESILLLTRCNKQYAVLEYEDGRTEGIGCMKQVSQSDALNQDAWTYNPEQNAWYICVDKNPDDIPPPEGWNADYIRVPKSAKKFWRNSQDFKDTAPYFEGADYSAVDEKWELCVVIPR